MGVFQIAGAKTLNRKSSSIITSSHDFLTHFRQQQCFKKIGAVRSLCARPRQADRAGPAHVQMPVRAAPPGRAHSTRAGAVAAAAPARAASRSGAYASSASAPLQQWRCAAPVRVAPRCACERCAFAPRLSSTMARAQETRGQETLSQRRLGHKLNDLVFNTSSDSLSLLCYAHYFHVMHILCTSINISYT
jgi:hypothetical protein